MKKTIILLVLLAVLTCVAVGLVACADKTYYNVTCQDCENGYVTVANTKVEAGEKVILAAHPFAGYRLITFLLDGEVMDGVSFVMPNKDVTVSAQFEAVTYSITYVLGDATVDGTNPDFYTVDSDVELIAPYKEGYEICGWYRYHTEGGYDWNIEDFRVTSLEGLFGNLTLYAKYYNPLHSISVEGSIDGDCFVDDGIYEARYGDILNLIITPDLGYELDYITVNGERIEGTSFIMPTEDVEIIATFKPIRYAITYVLDGGINSPDNPDFYTVEDWDITFYEPEKEGYIFYGWYYDEEYNNPVAYGFDVYMRRPITLYAYFVEEDEEY